MVQQVIMPQRQVSQKEGDKRLQTLSKIGQGIAAIGTATGYAPAAGIGSLMSLGAGELYQRSMKEGETSPNMAMTRRMEQKDPYKSLDEGIASLDELSLPAETKQRLLRPMLLARQGRV